MNRFIYILNLIKTHRNTNWLTPSQRKAVEALKNLLRIPEAVNLFGAIGVGKTFLAWEIADRLGYLYFPHREYLMQRGETDTHRGVIIDNCEPTRKFHRDTLKFLQIENITHAVLITREPIHDYIKCVELPLLPDDLDVVRNNLASIGVTLPEAHVPNLWHLINQNLPGGNNVGRIASYSG